MIRTFLQLAALRLAMVGALVAGSPGMELCVGHDGHFTIEPEHHDHFDDAHHAADTEHEGTAWRHAPASECEVCGCVDLPLDSAKLSQASSRLKQLRLEKSGSEPSFPFGYDPFVQTGLHKCRKPAYGATHILAQSLREKRTIVLLL